MLNQHPEHAFVCRAAIVDIALNKHFRVIAGPIILLTLFINAFGQAVTKTDIIGSWLLKDIKFLEPYADSTDMRSQSIGRVVQFVDSAKYISKEWVGHKWRIFEKGTYSISPDGKVMSQNGIDASFIKLSETEMTLKIDCDIVLYWKRIPNDD